MKDAEERFYVVRTVMVGREPRVWEECHGDKDNYKVGKRYVEYHIIKTVGPWGAPELTLEQATKAAHPYTYRNGKLISVQILDEVCHPTEVKVKKESWQ